MSSDKDKRDLEDGQKLGRLTDRDDAADADTPGGNTPPPIEPTDPGQSHDPNEPPPPRP